MLIGLEENLLLKDKYINDKEDYYNRMGESLSEDEFRKALYESLSKKGIVSSFKSHLRQQIALQLSLKVSIYPKQIIF